MDLRAHLMALLAPHRAGDALAPGVVIVDASTELGLRLELTVDGERLWIDVEPLDRVSRWAARSERLGLSYRTEGGKRQLDPARGRQVCERIAELARANEAAVFARIAAEVDREPQRDQRVRRIEVGAMLERTGPAGGELYTLSPYIGCTIGCTFCYAQDKVATMRALLGLREVPWGSYVDARTNAPAVLARELAVLPPLPIKFCPVVSDPYQTIERRERLTRRCLEAIRDAGGAWTAVVLTRSTLIRDDVDLLAGIPRAHAGVSLPTIDDDVRRHFEPRAASVDERLDVLRALRSAGVSAIAIVQPLLPGPVDALADALAATADSVSIDVLRGVIGASAEFSDPRYRDSRSDSWQRDRALALTDALARRGVAVWHSELPPALAT